MQVGFQSRKIGTAKGVMEASRSKDVSIVGR